MKPYKKPNFKRVVTLQVWAILILVYIFSGFEFKGDLVLVATLAIITLISSINDKPNK